LVKGLKDLDPWVVLLAAQAAAPASSLLSISNGTQ
jgi:hypothetical protein